MKEAPFEIRDALKSGLRNDVRMPRGASACVEMRNLKPTDMGARSPEILSYPITTPAYAQAWPYPQLVRSERTIFFRDATELRTVNESDWVTTLVTLRQVDDPTTGASLVSGGGTIHLAGFSDSYFMTDGVNLIVKTPAYTNALVFLNTVFRCATVHEFDRRLFIGGMQGTYFTSSRWTTLYDIWRDSSDGQVFTASDETLDTHYVLYSDEAGGDVDTPFEILKAVLGAEASDADLGPLFDEVLNDAIEQRRIGLIPCSFTGPILSLKHLGDNLIVYGQRGVSVFTKNPSGGYIETPVLMRGIASRGAVEGDDSEHVFVDTEGDLWRFTSKGHTRLGYAEYIGSLTIANVVVSFDPQYREFWISDGVDSYILNRSGLGGPVSLLPSSLVRSYNSGTLIGTNPVVDYDVTVTPPTDLDSTHRDIVLIRTIPVDLGQRGQKHVAGLQIASAGIRDGRGTVHYRYDQTIAAFTRRAQSKVTTDGAVRIDVNLVDGMIEVLGVAPTQTAEYDYIEVRYQTDDRSHIRGTQTNQPDRL